MASRAKSKVKAKARRNLFSELMEGMEALGESRRGKRTLRTHAVVVKPAPKLTPDELVEVRRRCLSIS